MCQILTGIKCYGEYLQSNENCKLIANRLNIRVVDYLLNGQHVDIFSPLEELDFKTVLEFCISNDLTQVVNLFVLQFSNLFFKHCFQMALANQAYDIIVSFIEDRDIPLPPIENVTSLISALKYTIQNNKLTSFKAIFQQLCIQQNIPMNEETDIPDDYCVPIF